MGKIQNKFFNIQKNKSITTIDRTWLPWFDETEIFVILPVVNAVFYT